MKRKCPICIKNKEIIFLHCGHHVCPKCWEKWSNVTDTCPICKVHAAPRSYVWFYILFIIIFIGLVKYTTP